MADITVAAASVGAVQKILTMDGPITGTLNVGDYAILDGSTGKWKRGDADAAATATYGGLVIEKNGNSKVTVLIIGIADCGDGVTGDYGSKIYLSDTAGSLADTAGTIVRPIGIVVPMHGHTTPTKGVLFIPSFALDASATIIGALTVLGNATFGDASTDTVTMLSRLIVRQVTDAGPMTATGGTEGEIVYNLSDDIFYGCTTGHASAATWAAVSAQTAFTTITATGNVQFDANGQFGNASTDVYTCTGRLLVRSVTDAGPMTATAGTQREIVYNTSDSKFYGCTVTHASAATWVALN